MTKRFLVRLHSEPGCRLTVIIVTAVVILKAASGAMVYGLAWEK